MQTLDATTIIDGLCFGEGPRWHDGALWFSDMHAHQVLRLTDDHRLQTVHEVPGQPSGLGWLPDGRLLVVSMTDRRLLREDDGALVEHADLSSLAAFHANDMVVDASGRAYVGNFGFDLHGGASPEAADLLRVDPDGSVHVAATDMLFANGSVITPDGATLIVGESFGARLTAFTLSLDGRLNERRVWAPLPDGAVPDGICLDAADGIWVASPTSAECLRVVAGGAVTHRVPLERGAFACMLGGADQCTLYILTAEDSEPEACRSRRSGRIEIARAPHPRTGWP